MTDVQLLAKVRTACRITQANQEINDELSDIIAAAFEDLSLSDINDATGNPYTAQTAEGGIIQAVITYARAFFGDIMDTDEQAQLLDRYDKQKAMLKMLKYSREES